MDADRIKGMAVVSITEGTRLGRVEDLLFDPQSLRVAALQVSSDSGTFILPIDQVQSIGTDAVIVENGQVLQAFNKGGAYGTLPGLSQIKRRKVVDGTGTVVGSVTGIDVDPIGGQLMSLTSHKGGVLGLGGTTTTIEAAAIRSIGPEVITVAADATPAPQ